MSAFATLLKTAPDALHDVVLEANIGRPEPWRFLMLVDQFEEVFTLSGERLSERGAFLDSILRAATAADGRVVVVVTMRIDFFGRCHEYPELARQIHDRHALVLPPDSMGMREAIIQPVFQVGLEYFPPGLVEEILQDAEGQPGALPLVQDALKELYKHRMQNRLTLDACHKIGRLSGALSQRAEAVYGGWRDRPELQGLCARVFTEIVETSDDPATPVTRRRRSKADLLPARVGEAQRRQLDLVLAELTGQRLIQTDSGIGPANGPPEATREDAGDGGRPSNWPTRS